MDILDAAVSCMNAFSGEQVTISSTEQGQVAVLVGSDTVAEGRLVDGAVQTLIFSLARSSAIAGERELEGIASKVTYYGLSMIRSDRSQSWKGFVVRSQEVFSLTANGAHATLCSDVTESSGLARKTNDLLIEIQNIKREIGEIHETSKGLIEE